MSGTSLKGSITPLEILHRLSWDSTGEKGLEINLEAGDYGLQCAGTSEEDMARYRAFLRTDRKREFRTESDYYCAFLPYISPEESKQLSAGHCNLFPYPRYPWEKKGSYGSCTGAMNKDAWLHAPRTLRVAGLSNRPRLKYSIMIVLQLVHPLRARCFARCCTTPVLADEL